MELKTFFYSEDQKKQRRRKPLSSYERHDIGYRKEFVKFCLSAGVKNTSEVDNKIYRNFVRHIKEVKNNSERTILDKCYAISRFLKKEKCEFSPKPWRQYVKNAE